MRRTTFFAILVASLTAAAPTLLAGEDSQRTRTSYHGQPVSTPEDACSSSKLKDSANCTCVTADTPQFRLCHTEPETTGGTAHLFAVVPTDGQFFAVPTGTAFYAHTWGSAGSTLVDIAETLRVLEIRDTSTLIGFTYNLSETAKRCDRTETGERRCTQTSYTCEGEIVAAISLGDSPRLLGVADQSWHCSSRDTPRSEFDTHDRASLPTTDRTVTFADDADGLRIDDTTVDFKEDRPLLFPMRPEADTPYHIIP